MRSREEPVFGDRMSGRKSRDTPGVTMRMQRNAALQFQANPAPKVRAKRKIPDAERRRRRFAFARLPQGAGFAGTPQAKRCGFLAAQRPATIPRASMRSGSISGNGYPAADRLPERIRRLECGITPHHPAFSGVYAVNPYLHFSRKLEISVQVPGVRPLRRTLRTARALFAEQVPRSDEADAALRGTARIVRRGRDSRPVRTRRTVQGNEYDPTHRRRESRSGTPQPQAS